MPYFGIDSCPVEALDQVEGICVEHGLVQRTAIDATQAWMEVSPMSGSIMVVKYRPDSVGSLVIQSANGATIEDAEVHEVLQRLLDATHAEHVYTGTDQDNRRELPPGMFRHI